MGVGGGPRALKAYCGEGGSVLLKPIVGRGVLVLLKPTQLGQLQTARFP